MSNFDVNKIGKRIALEALKLQGYDTTFPDEESKREFIIDQNGVFPIMMWSKTHQERTVGNGKHKVTGKDQDQMELIERNVKRYGDVWLVFIDALWGYVLGGPYSELMKVKEFEGLNWPFTEITAHGKIIYFNLYLLPTIGKISEDDLNELKAVIAQNRTPKGQGLLF